MVLVLVSQFTGSGRCQKCLTALIVQENIAWMKAPAQPSDKVSLFKKNHLTASWATEDELNTLTPPDPQHARFGGACFLSRPLPFADAVVRRAPWWHHSDMQPWPHPYVVCFGRLSPYKQCSQPQTEMFVAVFFSKLLSKLRVKEKLQLLCICVDVKKEHLKYTVLSQLSSRTHACPLLLYTQLVFRTSVWIPTNCRCA